MELKTLLNNEQYEAVTTIEGPLLILAGAGSGKTRVLTYRIAHMIQDLGIFPYSILAITFTNKAAEEMKVRIKDLIGDIASSMWISTFHSTCVKILRREIEKIGYNKNFNIYDSSEQKALIKQCMEELKINDKEFPIASIINAIGKQKDNLIGPTKFFDIYKNNPRMKVVGSCYELYQKKLKINNALDFDDLIMKTVELFKNNNDVLEFYQRKFKYIMVDEYQDTNKSQYELIRLLASSSKNICVVGDDDQCIYEWRGADISNILNFERDYNNVKEIKLEENYRSTKNILNTANSVIKNNLERKNKFLRTENEEGEKVKFFRAGSDTEEAEFVSTQIDRIRYREYSKYKDFAILYRTNAQSRIFEEVFMKRSIPYRIIGGQKFYDRKEIKDIIAYLRVINNSQDSMSLIRIINVPKRNIGKTTIDKLLEYSNEFDDNLYNALLDVNRISSLGKKSSTINDFVNLIEYFREMVPKLTVSELIVDIIEKTKYAEELKSSKSLESESRIENLEELVSAAVEFESSSEDNSLGAFLEKIALVTDIDNFNSELDTVTLMTVHSAKGLEFPIVFLVGMEDGIFPGRASLDDPKEMEESRRLFYVGVTRAKELLYITSSERRRIFGEIVGFPISTFVREMDKNLIEFLNEPTETKSVSKSNINNITILEPRKVLNNEDAIPGRKIRHRKFGVGTIINVVNEGNDTKITVAFDNMGIKTLLLSIAPLELM